ncbi:MAG: hypothetical protein ABS939_13185 [Psychrobacillus sp.]
MPPRITTIQMDYDNDRRDYYNQLKLYNNRAMDYDNATTNYYNPNGLR